MSTDFGLTGDYGVDVNNLITKLVDVQAKLKSCSDAGASTQNFVQLWHQVNTLHNELDALNKELKDHEKYDEMVHMAQNEKIDFMEQTIHGMTPEEVRLLKDAAYAVCSKARQTTLTLTNLDTGEKTSLMAVGKEHVDGLKEIINY